MSGDMFNDVVLLAIGGLNQTGPLKWIMLLVPVGMTIGAMRSKTGVAKFIEVGATSPDRARRPESLGMGRMFIIEGAIKRRILVPTGDGRYWVDLPRRRRRRAIILAVGLSVTATIALILKLAG